MTDRDPPSAPPPPPKSDPSHRAPRPETDFALESTVRRALPDTLGPAFTPQVMARVRAEHARGASLSATLPRLFPRVALPAVVAAAFFMSQNYAARTREASVIEALFGLPPASQLLLLER